MESCTNTHEPRWRVYRSQCVNESRSCLIWCGYKHVEEFGTFSETSANSRVDVVDPHLENSAFRIIAAHWMSIKAICSITKCSLWNLKAYCGRQIDDIADFHTDFCTDLIWPNLWLVDATIRQPLLIHCFIFRFNIIRLAIGAIYSNALRPISRRCVFIGIRFVFHQLTRKLRKAVGLFFGEDTMLRTLEFQA